MGGVDYVTGRGGDLDAIMDPDEARTRCPAWIQDRRKGIAVGRQVPRWFREKASRSSLGFPALLGHFATFFLVTEDGCFMSVHVSSVFLFRGMVTRDGYGRRLPRLLRSLGFLHLVSIHFFSFFFLWEMVTGDG